MILSVVYGLRGARCLGFAAALLALSAAVAPAQSAAVVRQVTGEVTLKAPGRDWSAAAVGMTVPRNWIISTGFGSSATLDLGDSQIVVRPLTRLLLEEILRTESTATTSVYLQVGRLRATVKTAEGLQHDFKLRSPISTAAVRGTDFEYDGYRVTGFEGLVRFSNRTGLARQVGPGERVATLGLDLPPDPEKDRAERTNIDPTNGSGPGGLPLPPPVPPHVSGVTIDLVWD